MTRAERIRELRRRDAGRRVFGAAGHGYRIAPASPRDIEALEVWCGGPLPQAYRDYLAEIGPAAGPYHGLLEPSRVRDEGAAIRARYRAQRRTDGTPADPFVLDAWILGGGADGGADFGAPPSPGGFIPICDEGCELVTVLVTSGACAGLVFDATALGNVGGRWRAARRPPGLSGAPLRGFPARPTFADWVDGWLEQCEHDLAA